MNVLLIGSGGREHALAWKIGQSPALQTLYCAPGNGGTQGIGVSVVLNIGIADDVITFCNDKHIGLVVIGPEAPLVDGLADRLRDADIPVFGPSAAAAKLEGSKHFTKALCDEHGIPTAAYAHFSDAASAHAYLENRSMPIVIKADGLAAGKGVTIAQTQQEAKEAIDACFDGAYGAAGAELVIEEFLEGEEASLFAICDGETILPFGTAQDHKRAFDNDEGPNTGGMGAYSPAPVMTAEMTARVMKDIVTPTVRAMSSRGTPFVGVLYAGLMMTDKGPKLIEYNVRFGDPECQVLMQRLQSDVLPILHNAALGQLETTPVTWRDQVSLTVVMAADGYPGHYEIGDPIGNLDEAEADPRTTIFHAGTRRDGDIVKSNGGRVLNVTALGDTVSEARERAYEAVNMIDWPGAMYRTDIGWRAIERERRAEAS